MRAEERQRAAARAGEALQRLAQESADLAGDVVHPATALRGDVKGEHSASCAGRGGRRLRERGTDAPESAGDGQESSPSPEKRG